ncbi:MAG: succinate dehydrogenase, hydrophobic membrane anchor protein [Pseudomonadota bacterium]|nr:succinate dehydrogenase, hydrophobic membrane anchor protein [Pseudomonadota bacterium]
MVGKGLSDWWMQRISSILISIFALPVLGLWFAGRLVGPEDWYDFLSSSFGLSLTLIGVIGFVLHTRIGLWVVITDYVPRHYQTFATWLMYIYLAGILAWALYLIWLML